MGFKEQVQEDLDTVFFCGEEFAESHQVNGREILIIVDNEQLAEFYSRKSSAVTEQIFTESILFYVRKNDLDFEPVPHQYLEYDGSGYLITDVKEDESMYAIVLEANDH